MDPFIEHHVQRTRRQFFGDAGLRFGGLALGWLMAGGGRSRLLGAEPSAAAGRVHPALPGLPHFAPKAKSAIPSPTGLALGMILPFQYPLSMLIGAGLAFAWQRARPASAEAYLVPVSSGVIAGVSILGVLVAILNQMVLPLLLGGAS